MSIQLTNTLSGQKEAFEPISKEQVLFYVCGVTVYDVCHIGHGRAYVVFDMIRRYLETSGYKVRFVQNFTDIDDKIIKRAQEKGVDYKDLTATYIDTYMTDMAALNVDEATVYPRATDFISEMIDIISGLIDKGHAYALDNGDVCFSVVSFKEYGKLSKKVLDDLEAGSRVSVDDGKRDPLDFVLWKHSKPGEPSWDSPWGAGRPGWHIECSAMAMHELAPTIDIHAGGADLVFPHHENEIAQSECFSGKPLAKYWLHNGFVTIDKEKMSKSLNNFITIRDILETVSGESLRFYLLRVHYRTPLHFSMDGLMESDKSYKRLTECIRRCEDSRSDLEDDDSDAAKSIVALEARFHSAMQDDFNSAEAIGVLFDLVKVVNASGIGGGVLQRLGQVLGLFLVHEAAEDSNLSEAVEALLADRVAARAAKDFQQSDAIRDQLKNEYGILVEDRKDGQHWSKI